MAKKKVLIVDDEQDLIDSVVFSLESEGIECIVSGDGLEGLSMAKSEKPDVIILDLMLPKINGYKVARLLKYDEKYKNIPIVMLTARGQQKDKDLGVKTGADEYVTKPFEMDNLMKIVRKHLHLPNPE